MRISSRGFAPGTTARSKSCTSATHGRIGRYVAALVGDHGRAEDVTQEVFLSALRSMRSSVRPIVFRPWIYEIARNACIDQHRRSARSEEFCRRRRAGAGRPRAPRALAGAQPAPQETLEAKEQLRDLCGAFGDLSETHHRILVLRELEGLSYHQIGERMGLSLAAVESTLFRARKRLNEEFDELETGRRCGRIEGIIAAAVRGRLSPRDRRRLSHHLSGCERCRRQARQAGLSLPPRTSLGTKIGGLLPLPAWLRLRRSGAPAADGSVALTNWTWAATSAAEPLSSNLGKVVAAAATLAVAAAGSSMVSNPDPSKAAGRPRG